MLYRLSDLGIGVSGVVRSIEDPMVEVKLMEMGCIPGERFTVKAIAPFGDPIALWIAGYCLSMRKSEAGKIWVELEP